jgi:mRNA-degrading endonuclease RelE of RelBE toxin-antitoxin system
MPIEVVSTRRAQQQAEDLDRRHALAFTAFVDDLARNGCAALGYRLTGPVPISRMCVKHLRGTIRVVVAFESPRRVCIVLVGPHDDTDPSRDVYAELYELLDSAPLKGSGRRKPPCCGEDGQAPTGIGDDLADLIIRTARQRRPLRRKTRP